MKKIKFKKMILTNLLMGISFLSYSQDCPKNRTDNNGYIVCEYPPDRPCFDKLRPRLSLIESTNPFPFKNQEEVPKGLLIYNIAATKDLTIGLYSWNGKKWVKCENPTLQEAMEL